jgi:relaxase-like protein/mobilization protein MobC
LAVIFKTKFPVELMARPKVPEAERRSAKFTLMLTPAELAKLVQLGEVCNKPPATLAREKIFKGKYPAARIPKIDVQAYTQLQKIGTNLNQLTRLANSGKLPRELLGLLLKLNQRLDLTLIKIVYDSESKIGKSFMGALNYNLKKLFLAEKDRRAELLSTNFSSTDVKGIAKEIEMVRSLRPNLNRYVYHTSLNFPKEEQAHLSKSKLLAIARDYLEAMGFSNNQYLIFLHHDADHPHLHLLVNRIRFDGSIVSDSNNFKRSEAIVRFLENRYWLTQVRQGKYSAKHRNNDVSMKRRNSITIERSNNISQRAPSKNEIEMSIRTGKGSNKMVLQETLKRILQNRGQTLADFIRRCEAEEISLLFNQASTGRISGVTYFCNGFKSKGQALGERFKWAEIIKSLNYEQIRDGKTIGETNSRTLAKYGELDSTKQSNNTRAGHGVAELHRSCTEDIEFDGWEQGFTDEASRTVDPDRAQALERDVANDHISAGSNDYHSDRFGGFIDIQISDDIDDETIHGRKRLRRR